MLHLLNETSFRKDKIKSIREDVIIIPRPKSMETKELIRKAAVEVISEVGFHNCNTHKIAEAAGVSVGTIYNYFRNKKDILCYIFEVEHKNLKGFFDYLDQKEIKTPEKIRLFLEKYFKRIREDWNLSKLLHDESNRPAQGLSREIMDYLIMIHGGLSKLLEEGIKEGSVYPDIDPLTTAAMIIGASGSVALTALFQPDDLEEISLEAPDKIICFLVRGIFSVDYKAGSC